METKVVLYGASGHGKVILDILQSNFVTVDVIIDDHPKVTHIAEVPVLHSSLITFSAIENMIISIGNNRVRRMISISSITPFLVAIHPKAIVAKSAFIGEGTVVMAGALINPDVKIGKHSIINTGAIVDHDCIVEDFVHISPGVSLAGNVLIGEGTHVGIGAVIIQGVKIGRWATIGAGAVILKDVPDYAVVVGNPGKIIKFNSNE